MKLWQKVSYIIISLVLALWPVAVLAIALPTSYSIDSIEAYRHVVEQNDQLYVIKYEINYAVLPTESAQESWLVRLMDGANELGVTSPFAYHTNGYGKGIATIYFSANSTPAWAGAYSVRLEGNPLLVWAGGVPPSTSSAIFAKWSTSTSISSTSTELRLRILYLANELTTSWSTNLTELSNGVTVLSASGEYYFESLFPVLRTVCPQLFGSVSVNPIKDVRTQNLSAANANDSQLIGTIFDFTPLANALHLSREWTTGIIWTIFWFAICVGIVWKLEATRIALFLFGFMEVAGAISGWMGMIVGGMIGDFGALCIVYGFMWKRAT